MIATIILTIISTLLALTCIFLFLYLRIQGNYSKKMEALIDFQSKGYTSMERLAKALEGLDDTLQRIKTDVIIK